MSRQLLYLTRADVAAVGPSMVEIIDLLEQMFRDKAAGRTEMPPKPGVHPRPDAFMHAMPAYIPAMNSAGVKWVTGYPQNQERGLPYINGLLILNEPDTGLPLAVMDCTWITAERTAAASAVAAKYLARPESSILGILGCGEQGRSHVRAYQAIFELERIVAFDTDLEVARDFCRDVAERAGIETVLAAEPRDAVTGCDLVVTAGPILTVPHATISRDWMDPGAFASLVDFDSYWHPDALAQLEKFSTDDLEQLDYYRARGYFKTIPPIHAELHELIAGTKPGRTATNERTAACNLGMALEDMAVAPRIYERARKQGAGTYLDL